jgi:hypothetical protein
MDTPSVTYLPQEEFDELLETLDKPDPISPILARLVEDWHGKATTYN